MSTSRYQSVVPLLLLSPMKPPRAASDEAINTIIPIGDSGTTEKGTSNEATTARMWRDSATTVQWPGELGTKVSWAINSRGFVFVLTISFCGFIQLKVISLPSTLCVSKMAVTWWSSETRPSDGWSSPCSTRKKLLFSNGSDNDSSRFFFSRSKRRFISLVHLDSLVTRALLTPLPSSEACRSDRFVQCLFR